MFDLQYRAGRSSAEAKKSGASQKRKAGAGAGKGSKAS